MSAKKQQEESVSRKVFWPIWAAGRFMLGMVFLSMFALALALYFQKSGHEFSIDGVKQPVTPAYMLELNRRSMEHSANAWLSEQTATAFYVMYFKWTGIHRMAMQQQQERDTYSSSSLSRAIQQNPDSVAVAMLATRLFGIRTGNVILSLPLIFFVVMLATVDGLAERAIRRECGGHESGTRFRIAKKFAFSLLPPVVALVYLCLPIDVSLGAVMLPALAVTAILFRTKMKYFKKYI